MVIFYHPEPGEDVDPTWPKNMFQMGGEKNPPTFTKLGFLVFWNRMPVSDHQEMT